MELRRSPSSAASSEQGEYSDAAPDAMAILLAARLAGV
jgi:hypothetical protein